MHFLWLLYFCRLTICRSQSLFEMHGRLFDAKWPKFWSDNSNQGQPPQELCQKYTISSKDCPQLKSNLGQIQLELKTNVAMVQMFFLPFLLRNIPLFLLLKSIVMHQKENYQRFKTKMKRISRPKTSITDDMVTFGEQQHISFKVVNNKNDKNKKKNSGANKNK